MSRFLVVAACSLIALPVIVILSSFLVKTESPWFGKYEQNARTAYDFQLLGLDGEKRLSDFRGKMVLLSFGFTNCPSICPAVLANLSGVVRELPEAERGNVSVVFVTLDPERDSVKKLAEYVAFFDPSFFGLGGEPDQIAAAAKAYGVVYRKAPGDPDEPGDYSIDHSTDTFLIDASGKLRMVFRLDQLPDSERVAADILRVNSAD